MGPPLRFGHIIEVVGKTPSQSAAGALKLRDLLAKHQIHALPVQDAMDRSAYVLTDEHADHFMRKLSEYSSPTAALPKPDPANPDAPVQVDPKAFNVAMFWMRLNHSKVELTVTESGQLQFSHPFIATLAQFLEEKP
jgi:hypothetical protein